MHCFIVFPFLLKYLTNSEHMISSWPVWSESTLMIPNNFLRTLRAGCWTKLNKYTMLYQSNASLGCSILIEIDGFRLTNYKFNVCHPEVFITYINIQWCIVSVWSIIVYLYSGTEVCFLCGRKVVRYDRRQSVITTWRTCSALSTGAFVDSSFVSSAQNDVKEASLLRNGERTYS